MLKKIQGWMHVESFLSEIQIDINLVTCDCKTKIHKIKI